MLRRTKNISLVMLAAIAATACDENQSQAPAPNPNEDLKHCVDENGVVQDEEKCKDAPEAHPMGPDGGPIASHPSSGGGGHFFWYYGGTGGRTVSPGTRVGGGSYTPSPGKAYSPPSIGRGGFGSTGAGHGSTGGGS